ncbi:histidine phosphatase family protein [Catenulispora pinisilvae]|uniref:histidine phosphatase family protein n=1 Tax=Catenulispora pinisilvae TaxID=2705253 RepID=UPI00189157E6|nr:phosphoglycerate mutase family protein [Catenulispora pinisilvae]
MPVLQLVRHGQASAHAADYDVLSELGAEQSRAVGRELARRGLRDPLVVCGTLRRQRDTAEALIQVAGLRSEPETDARWNEYDHLALLAEYPYPEKPAEASGQELAGHPHPEKLAEPSMQELAGYPHPEKPTQASVQDLIDSALSSWIADPDGSWPAFAAGAVAALRELAATLGRGRDAVVVSSGGVIAAVAGALLGAPASGVVALNRVTVNAGVTTVTSGASGLSLLTFNDHAHLAGGERRLITYR